MARSSGKDNPPLPPFKKGGRANRDVRKGGRVDRNVKKEGKIHWGNGEIGGPRHEYRESLILRMIKDDLQTGSVVLDAGCGSGSLLFKLARLNCRVYGIEQSNEFVKMLRKRVKAPATSSAIQVKHGSVINTPYPDSTFDVVVSGDVLEHVKDDAGAIKEFFRVLRPGGVCAVSVPASPALWDFTDEWAGHLRRYTKEGLVTLFEKNGFIVDDVRFWGFPVVRLYHRFVYLPHVRKKTVKGVPDANRPPDASRHQWATTALKTVFEIDSLFRWLPFGVGLILKARKVDVQ